MTEYAPPVEPVLRNNLHAVCQAYCAATGVSESRFSREVMQDGSFLARLRIADASFRVGTYDSLMAHLSFIWPAEVEWPAEIPRPAPAERVHTARTRRAKETADG